jgi:hypothetical protein
VPLKPPTLPSKIVYTIPSHAIIHLGIRLTLSRLHPLAIQVSSQLFRPSQPLSPPSFTTVASRDHTTALKLAVCGGFKYPSSSPPRRIPLPSCPHPPPSPHSNTVLLLCNSVTAQLPPWKLPGWSQAGYRQGRPLPQKGPSPIYDVTKYGAVADGKTDASSAIQAAINDAAILGGGTVFIPAGRYVLRSPLRISSSNTLLKGAGSGKTVLYAPRPLAQARPNVNYLKPSGESRYCWNNAFIEVFGKPKDSQRASSLLATVALPRRRGLTSVRVAVTPGKKIQPGEELYLFMSDPPRNSSKTGSLVAALHGWNVLDGDTIPAVCGPGAACLQRMFGERDVVRWTVRVKEVRKGGTVLVLDRPLPFDVRPEWRAQFHRFLPKDVLRGSGVEGLTIEFALAPAAPHHLEKGYNGIELRWTVDSWVRDVAVLNADNAVFVRTSHHVSVTKVTTGITGSRATVEEPSTHGHIGIAVIGSADVLVSQFNVAAPMLHDTTVVKTTLTVWHRGTGANLNLDGHRHACYANLYDSIDVGAGTRPFTTGGMGEEGFPLGAYTTFWRIDGAAAPMAVRTELEGAGPCSFGGRFLAFVGKFVQEQACKGWFVRGVKVPQPPDLYEWQAAGVVWG